MPPKSEAKSKGKAKAKGKGKAKVKPAPDEKHASEPVTDEQRAWCVQFEGIPLSTCSEDLIPRPPTLNSAQTRIWLRLFKRGQEHMVGDRADAADTAMRKVLDKFNQGDPDTIA